MEMTLFTQHSQYEYFNLPHGAAEVIFSVNKPRRIGNSAMMKSGVMVTLYEGASWLLVGSTRGERREGSSAGGAC